MSAASIMEMNVRRNVLLSVVLFVICTTAMDRHESEAYRERVRAMFVHSYDSYMEYAFPLDELRPLSCDGFDTWGSNSLTLIDSLSTLVVLGNYSEFRKAAKLILENADFNKDLNVSVFETNIRVVGGLLSAQLLSKKAGLELAEGWPCEGPLLNLAVDVADRLLPAFNTSTGMPYGTVNLRYGVPPGETSVTCTAGVGTFIVEFATLSRLTGNPVYEKTAARALQALWETRSKIDLVGNHIDVQTGKWTATDASIGAGVDSYYEYLVKGAMILRERWLLEQFETYRQAINHYMRKHDWFVLVKMNTGEPTMPYYQSLESFWPGTLTLVGHVEEARRSLYNYHQVWKQIGFIPEFYDIARGQSQDKREGYPLRPEFVESVMHMYQATKDPHFLEMGVDVLTSLEHSAKTRCGYATVKNSFTHLLENRMESFFLAETTKYLYLLFDVDNFVHNPYMTHDSRNVTTRDGYTRQCFFDSGSYVFNTEAHLIDMALLDCCQPENLAYEIQSVYARESPRERQRLINTFSEVPNCNGSTIEELSMQCHESLELTENDKGGNLECMAQHPLNQFALRGQIIDIPE